MTNMIPLRRRLSYRRVASRRVAYLHNYVCKYNVYESVDNYNISREKRKQNLIRNY